METGNCSEICNYIIPAIFFSRIFYLQVIIRYSPLRRNIIKQISLRVQKKKIAETCPYRKKMERWRAAAIITMKMRVQVD